MKKLALIITIALMAGCAGNRTSYLIRTNAVNSAEACELLVANQKYQYKQSLKNSRKKSQRKSIHVFNREVISREITKEVALGSAVKPISEVKLLETEQSIVLVPNEFVLSDDKPFHRIRSSKQSPSVKISETCKANRVATFIKTSYQSFRENTKILFLIGLAGLAAVGLMKAGERKSMQMSRWSKAYPMLSRSAIVGAQSVAMLGGMAIGHDLYSSGIMIPEYSRWLPVGIFTAAASFYPNKFVSGNIPTFSYMTRKAHDIALFTSSAMMMTYAGNHYSLSTQPQDNREAAISISTTYLLSLKKNDFSTYPADPEKRKGMTKGQKVFATIGVSILFTFLALVVAAFSCSLSCAGNAGAAILVGYGGGGLVVLGLVALYRRIFTAPTKKRNELVPVSSV